MVIMKTRTIIIAILAAMSLTAAAQGQPRKNAAAVPAKEFSYAMGVSQAPSLKTYLLQSGVDTAYLSYAAKALTEAAGLSDDEIKQKVAYALGLNVAKMNIERVVPTFNQAATGKKDTVYTDLAIFSKGLADGLMGKATISADSATKVSEAQFEYFKQSYKRQNADFLVANAKKKGIKTLESGLQYRVIKKGKGAVANDTTEVDVHYEGRLIDGKVFDSSYKRNQPLSFKPTQVIKGWSEALKMMPEGSVYELFIPYDLGYGERGAGQDIPPYSTLIFKVEVIKVKK